MKEKKNKAVKVIKRDGSEVSFDIKKIGAAIQKAAIEVGPKVPNPKMDIILRDVYNKISSGDLVTVEKIQDKVEEVLMDKGFYQVAKAYILYRERRSALREQGWDMTDLQRDILYNKYVYKDEGFNGFVERVGYKNAAVQKLIRDKKFLPAGRILMGRRLFEYGKKVTYSNCMVLSGPEDNIESIFDVAKKMARTYSYGGGVGINLGRLRPIGSLVQNAAKETTGAVSFMDLYSLTTGLISQKGRRGALMITMPVDHPDIEDFIDVKTNLDKVNFANISVMVTDDFMRAVREDREWEMTFHTKATGEVVTRKAPARKLIRKIALNNWRTAEPGMLYWDRVQNYHINDQDETFVYEATNP